MANQNTIQESTVLRKNPVFKKLGKFLSATALAFTAQYGNILHPSPAQATEPAITQQQGQVQESPLLQQLDQEYLLVDEARTLKTGLVYMRGENVVAFPVVDPDTKENILLALRYIGKLPEEETDPFLEKISQTLGCGDCKILNQGTASYAIATDMLLKGGNPTDDEKRKLYYNLAFFHAVMAGGGISDNQDALDEDIAKFQALNDETPWFQERMKDMELFKASVRATSQKLLTESETARKNDVQRELSELSYSTHIQNAVNVLASRTSAYQAGEMPLNEYVMGLAIFAEFSKEHLTYLENLPKRGWFGGYVYQEAMKSIEVILPTLQEACDAVGNEETIPHLAQVREKLMVAKQLLDYQGILASKAYTMPNYSIEDIMRGAQENYRFSQAVVERHGAQKLYLSADFEPSLQIAYTRYAGALPRLAELHNANNTGSRLSQLIQKVDSQNNTWSNEDKSAFKELFQTALMSPSTEASEAFIATLQKEAILVSGTNIHTEYFKDTGKRVNFVNTITYEDANGMRTDTTLHPVDTITATFTIENKLPIPIRVPVKMQIPRGISDNSLEIQDVYVPANKFADVTYTVNISRASVESLPAEDLRPTATPQIAMKTIQEVVASINGGERLASAQ